MKILVIIGIILAFIFIMNLIHQVSKYLSILCLLRASEVADITNNKRSNLSSNEKIECSTALLNLINELIQVEITTLLNTFTDINKPYPLQNIENDISRISQKVFDGIRNELFVAPDIILNDEYIISYITSNTTIVLINSVKGYNQTLQNSGLLQ